MTAAQLKSEKFAEDLYFLLMSSPMQNRVMSLAHRHGLSRQKLRSEFTTIADDLSLKIETSPNKKKN